MREEVEPWHLSDVPALLTEVARRVPLRAGFDVVAVVDTSPKRELLGCEVLPLLPRLSTGYEVWNLARHVLEEVFVRLCPERAPGDPASCTIHLIRCRDGRAVPTPDEGAVGYAMLYANNPVQAFIGDVITLTPHGWCEQRRGGFAPTLVPTGQTLRAM